MVKFYSWKSPTRLRDMIPKKKGCRSKMLKTLLVSILAVAALALPTATAEATNVPGRTWLYNGGWTLVDSQNRHNLVTGWFNAAEPGETPVWFLFNNAGILQTGWQQVGNQRFFLRNTGVPNSGDSTTGLGVMLVGDQIIGNEHFFFNNAGVMQTGWANGYRLYHANGHQLRGWHRMNGQWFYLPADGGGRVGNATNQVVHITSSHPGVYLFHNGVMQTGWTNVGGGNWMFSAGSGRIQSNIWRRSRGHWYHIGNDGLMTRGTGVQAGIRYIQNTAGGSANNGWFSFANDGRMRTGWFNVDGTYYLTNASGRMIAGWNGRFHLGNGITPTADTTNSERFGMLVGTHTIAGVAHTFDVNGRLLGTAAAPNPPQNTDLRPNNFTTEDTCTTAGFTWNPGVVGVEAVEAVEAADAVYAYFVLINGILVLFDDVEHAGETPMLIQVSPAIEAVEGVEGVTAVAAHCF